MLLHITTNSNWQNSLAKGVYQTETLQTDGFIHCSFRYQLLRVANFLFKGQKDLVLLVIDETMLTSPVKYEDLYNLGEKYPHIYGVINIDSVIVAHQFLPEADGNFKLPDYV